MPYWGGWYGVLYDPTLTRAIYPRNVGNDRKYVTYGLWDVSKGRLLTSLEDVFMPLDDASLYYMPTWSPDGSQFVFEGLIVTPDVAEFELYRVSRDGKIEQLTHLNLAQYVEPDNLRWSPNSQFIAMYLQNIGPQLPQQQRVAILDTMTLEITDFCFLLSGDMPAPIWSPDGQQFLVSERGVDHPRVILVDIVKGFAAQISQDTEATGWMASGQ